jgi:hypothetical protein
MQLRERYNVFISRPKATEELLLQKLTAAGAPAPPQEVVKNLASMMDEAEFPLLQHLLVRFPVVYINHEECRLWRIPVVGVRGPAMRREAVDSYNYLWAHATTEGGLVGILKDKMVQKSRSSEEEPTSGFFCKACEDSEYGAEQIVINRAAADKNRAGIIVQGTVSIDNMHKRLDCGGTAAEQKACEKHGVSHMASARRWCVREDLAQITSFWIVQQK